MNKCYCKMTGLLSPMDPSSYSRPDIATVTNIFLNLSVDFVNKILSGYVEFVVKRVDKRAEQIILDTYKLNILAIKDKETNENLEYNLSDYLENYGSKLTVQLPKNSKASCRILIQYETSPGATGLQWLDPIATAGKKHPYLFSHFEPTHARSVLPCQDTPAVKTPYIATISAPSEFTVLMSAIRDGTKLDHGRKLSNFSQTVPVPSYLIALAVGVLESRQLGPRSHVWAEKEIVDECAYEFAETEHQLKTAEEICGRYVWSIYDLLVLPPSFPFGGTENPCLTYITPTLLAGDRSLANVVAHEIAHSWTGNLVTNRNFEHFWLNEGFTVFVERKIKGRLESPESQDFDAYIGLIELQNTIDRIGKDNQLTNLVVSLRDVHPDESFSLVPYEKGQTFLRYLEDVVGGPSKFEPFLLQYFNHFKFKSIDSSDFQAFFEKHFKELDAIKLIDWKTWLYSPGMPPVIPEYNKTLAEDCDNFVDKFLKWSGETDFSLSKRDIATLSCNQVVYILQKLMDTEAQSIRKLQTLEQLFDLKNIKNAEIKYRWLMIGLKAHWEDKIQPTFDWINVVGRMKFVRPLYRQLYEWDVTKQKAVDNFLENRDKMMHVTAFTVAKDLHLEN